MRRAPGVLLALTAATASTASGQRIGEVRMLGTIGWAPGSRNPPGGTDGFPIPRSRALAGAGASLSFVSGDISAGPEAVVLHGSDRKMFAVGGVARLAFARGRVRPYILVGAGVYTWNHKAALPPGLGWTGQPSGPIWLGDVTQWSGNAGGGLVVGQERMSLTMEVRGHKSLTEDEWAGSREALGFSAGGRLSW